LGDPEAIQAAVLRLLPQSRSSAVNATVVMTKSDLLAGEEIDLANLWKTTLGAKVAAVTPFKGLLAETANADLIANDDVALLGELAHMDSGEREDLLRSPDAFLTGDAPVARAERVKLLERFGLYGLRCALELADVGQLSGVGLRRRLRELSGIDAVNRQIDFFHQRADALKTDRALDRLEELSYRWPTLAFLRDQVEALRLESQMHVIDLIRVFERCALGEVDVPRELLIGLERLITGSGTASRLGLEEDADAEQLHAAAIEGFRAWKTLENASQVSPATTRAARTVARSYEIYARADSESPSAAASVRIE
jgi:hypothetical protein